MKQSPFVVLAVSLLCAMPAVAQNTNAYYRFPAIHDRTLVFAAEGDLWVVSTEGGTARRLTTHAADETNPVISPDGATVAFSAVYEGARELYTMPLNGGLPIRHTFGDGRATPTSWTPDGKVVFSTRRYSGLPGAQLAVQDPAARARTMVPLAQAAQGVFDDRGTLFFTRLPKMGSNAKRYRGGTAENLWSYAPDAEEAVPLTADYPGTSANPMLWQGRLYFTTDRDGTMNLWSMQPDGTGPVQHTHHVGWDVKSPSLSNGRIAYQLGADIWLYDIAADETHVLEISVPSDFDQLRERWITNPVSSLSSAHVSNDGSRVALVSRGEVFVAPAESGRFVHVSRNSDVRFRGARFMPDGQNLMTLSDESGEVEWWQLPANGIGERRQITSNGTILRNDGTLSPNGEWLVHWNRDQELWLQHLPGGESRKIDFSTNWGYGGVSWSPDSRWFVYSMPAENGFSQLFLYDVESGDKTPITTDRYNDWSPAWSPDGDWIYFLSDRNLRTIVGAPWGVRQPQPFFDKQDRLYAIPLEAVTRSPFRPDDELFTSDSSDHATADSAVTVTVQLDGISQRIMELPVPPGDYSNLSVNGQRLFWQSRETSLPRNVSLMFLKIDNEGAVPKTLVENIRGYELSGDGKHLMLRKGSDIYVVKASSSAGASLADARVNLSNWAFSIEPRQEWRQIFLDAWRLHRDYFYDPGMHGVDWDAMRDRYLPLVDRVRTRGDLSDIQAQLVGELSALHSNVRGGDFRRGADSVSIGFLGARLTRSDDRGGYLVDHIYRSDPDIPGERSPLLQPGVNVAEGDVITAINGVPVLQAGDPGAFLRYQSGRQVRISVTGAGQRDGRDFIVTPISSARDFDLRYDEWEYDRRLMTDSLGSGEIGYLHLRAMGGGNIAEWYREFYPVFNRSGLIIDVRHNNGGNIDSWILEKLMRQAWMYWQPRVGQPYWNMQQSFRGHIVVLVDEYTASDGEAFAEGFKRLGLGTVIGTRTWGGEIWLTSSNRQLDGGIARAAEFGVYGPEGEWLIEGWGVEPDVVVDNLPHATYLGEDAQLRAAVELLQRQIRDDPRPVPPAPPYPDKSVPYNSAGND